MTTRTENENAYIIHDDRGHEFKGAVTFDQQLQGAGVNLLQNTYRITTPSVNIIGNNTVQNYTFVGAGIDNKWNSTVVAAPVISGIALQLPTSGIYSVNVRMYYDPTNFGAGDIVEAGLYLGAVLMDTSQYTHYTALNWGAAPEIACRFTGYVTGGQSFSAVFKWDDVSAGTAVSGVIFLFEISRIC